MTVNAKNIALVAHDNCKSDLVDWVGFNYFSLLYHNLFCTGTTGTLIEQELIKRIRKFNPEIEHVTSITKFNSGPLGGDQEIGAAIANRKIDIMFFFWDPLSAHPHDMDIKALLRICNVYNIPVACNRSTADFLISSPLFVKPYQPKVYDYSQYLSRLKK